MTALPLRQPATASGSSLSILRPNREPKSTRRRASWTREAVRDTALSHLLVSLEAVPHEDEPFSHFYLDGVLPDDLYAELLRQMPEPESYRPLQPKKYVREDGVSTRDLLELAPESLELLPDAQREFWSGLAEALKSAEFKEAVFHKLGTDLTRRFRTTREKLSEVEAYPKPALIRDLGGYEIAPHPDVKKKIVTMQLYLPTDTSQLDLGTAIYRRRHTPLAVVSRKHRFEKVKQFAFMPNSGYGFAVSSYSWHGRERVPMAAGVRNSLLVIYYSDPTKGY